MFLFDESERTRIDDFRDEVHDSDGLQIVLASGERVWRPLRNPTQLQVSSFTSEAPKAFGLIQRSRRASDYHDLEAHYEKRPSAWIEPTSRWGAGSVQLVEIPTDNETNDNIVAFWRPKHVIPAGKPWHTSYRMRWNSQPKLTPALGKATATRTGPSFDGKRRIFVIEFSGTGRSIEGLKLDAGTSAGKLIEPGAAAQPAHQGRARQLRTRSGQRRRRRIALACIARQASRERNLAVPMDSQLKSAIPPEGRDVVRGGMPFERPLDMPVQDLRRAPASLQMEAAPARAIFARALDYPRCAWHHRLRRVRDARHRQLRQHDGAAGRDDPVLRGHARVDRLRSRIRDHRLSRASAARQSEHVDRRQSHGAGHADLQRRSRAHDRRLAGDGGSTGADRRRPAFRDRRSSPIRPTPTPGSANHSRSTNCVATLRETMPVWYRRRWHNAGRKAGNVEEFVKRWGGRYDYMIVLDADSLMSPRRWSSWCAACRPIRGSAFCRPYRC